MHPMLYFIFLLIGSFVTVTPSQAGDENSGLAPFGLQWGMSSSQVRALGVEIKEATPKDYGTSYVATKLPKIISDVETVVLSFGFDDKLWRIAAISQIFPHDPYGAAVRARYVQLSKELAEKYGRGEQHDQPGQDFYAEPDNFVYAIQSGHAWYYTNYTTNTLNIQLNLRASGLDTAFYQIIFQYKPLLLQFDKNKKAQEKNSL